VSEVGTGENNNLVLVTLFSNETFSCLACTLSVWQMEEDRASKELCISTYEKFGELELGKHVVLNSDV
jgi:hypothetical protein